MDAATGDEAWARAMLDVEAALARGGAAAGLVPPGAAEEIAAAADSLVPDLHAVAASAAAEATPVIELVRQLRAAVGDDAAAHVHRGATSQDVVDTGGVLVARRSLAVVVPRAWRVADLLAGLAREHRGTLQAGRTLLQRATVTTFGAACAARLVAVVDATANLTSASAAVPLQLGGAAGSLDTVGPAGAELPVAVAHELGLAVPVTPWHTSRGRVAELSAACGVLAGELAAVAGDLVLLASSEVGELTPAAPGGSSAMRHKQNPSHAVLAVAAAHRTPGLVATVLAAMPQELQRSAGRWQAEWTTVSELLRGLGGAVLHTEAALDGLVVHADRMSAHVRDLVAATGRDGADPGSAPVFVDRALAHHARLRPGTS